MKTKLKSMSKRTLSIILVLLMVVSTVTVGIITTTAAYTELDNEAVGASAGDEEVGVSVDEDEAVGDNTFSVNSNASGSWAETSAVSTSKTITVDANYWLSQSTKEMNFGIRYNGNYYKKNVTFNSGETKYIDKDGDGDSKVNITKRYVTFKITNTSFNLVNC